MEIENSFRKFPKLMNLLEYKCLNRSDLVGRFTFNLRSINLMSILLTKRRDIPAEVPAERFFSCIQFNGICSGIIYNDIAAEIDLVQPITKIARNLYLT